MTTLTSLVHRGGAVAPWFTLAILPMLAWALPNRTIVDERAQQRQIELRHAIENVPLLIGPWIGEDQHIATEAQQLLRPNAILSRTYRTLDEASVHVMCVHCSDARDMIGHYPPVCYPSSGWVRHRARIDGPVDRTLTIDGIVMPVRLYEFERMRDGNRRETIRILNTFVLPDGTSSRDIDDINRQSERLAVSTRGVAQLQILTSASIPADETIRLAEEVLGGMDELFVTLRSGAGTP